MKVEAEQRGRSMRLMFYGKQPIKFTPIVSDHIVTIRFARGFTSDLASIKRRFHPGLQNASVSKDGKTFLFVFEKGRTYQVRKFISDDFVGVDVIRDTPFPEPEPLAQPVKAIPPEPSSSSKQPDQVVKKEVIKEEIVKRIPVPVFRPVRKAKVPEASSKVADKKKASSAKKAPSKEKAKPSDPAKEKASKKKKRKEKTVSLARAHSGVLPLKVRKKGKEWVFAWKEHTAAAMFYRAGHLWVIFGRYAPVDFEKAFQSVNSRFDHAEQFKNKHYTILRFSGKRLRYFYTRKEGTSWVIRFTNSPVKPSKILREYHSPHSRGIFFPAKDMVGPPIKILDPVVSDALYVVLFRKEGVGVERLQKFVDFHVIPSYQGLVIMPISDNVRVNIIRSGMEVYSPTDQFARRLKHQEDLRKLHFKRMQQRHNAQVPSLYHFERWKNPNDREYIRLQKQIERKLFKAPPQKRNIHRLEMAKLLFSRGLIPETLSTLNYIRVMDPIFGNRNDVLTLEGAANYLMRRHYEAKSVFDRIDVNQLATLPRKELVFWKSANEIAITGESKTFDYILNHGRFIKNYPTALRMHFALLDMRQRLDRGKVEGARLLAKLIRRDLDKEEKHPDFRFHLGLLELKRGKLEKANTYWVPLENNVFDRFNRARATFIRTKTAYEMEKIPLEEAIERLEKVTSVWRNDKLERDILSYLGKLYVKNERYLEALRAWRQIVTYFPNSGDALLIAAEMSKLFVELFAKGKIDDSSLSDLEALALYYEFRELTPIGKEGDRIVHNLTDKLVNLDLLERAESLLDHQVRYRLKGDSKVPLGAKLAFVYLMNQKPDKAIEALDLSMGRMSEELGIQRNQLRAKALADMHQYDDAVELLIDDYTVNADRLRIDIAWETSEWIELIQVLEPYLPEWRERKKPFSEEIAHRIVQLALAYDMLDEQDKLSALFKEMHPRIPEKMQRHRNALAFILTAKNPIDNREFDDSLGVHVIEAFMDDYRKNFIPPLPKREKPKPKAEDKSAEKTEDGSESKEKSDSTEEEKSKEKEEG